MLTAAIWFFSGAQALSLTEWISPTSTVRYDSGYLNSYEDEIDWEATAEDEFVCGLISPSYSGYPKQDRIFKADLCRFKKGLTRFDEHPSGMCNQYKGGMNCMCRANEGMYGFASTHDSGSDLVDDRRWTIKCAQAIGTKITSSEEEGAHWTVYTEHKESFDLKCSDQEVVCGLKGYYWGHHFNRDRSYSVKCCPVEVEQAGCTRVEVDIKKQILLDTRANPETDQLDELTINACGSQNKLTQTLKQSRSVTVENTETITISDDWTRKFSHKVTESFSISFKFGLRRRRRLDAVDAWIIGDDWLDEVPLEKQFSPWLDSERRREGDDTAGAGTGKCPDPCTAEPTQAPSDSAKAEWKISHSFTKSSSQSGSQTTVESKKQVNTQTFSSGFSVEAQPGTTTKALKMAGRKHKNIHWFGTATCYNGEGQEIDQIPVEGMYENSEVAEQQLFVETTHCPTDGWKLHEKKTCAWSDFMMNESLTDLLYGINKFAAIEWCELEDECDCVVDLNCNNEDLVQTFQKLYKGISTDPTKPTLWQTAITGNFLFCRQGCKDRLQTSAEACALNEEYPDRTAPSGGTSDAPGTGAACTNELPGYSFKDYGHYSTGHIGLGVTNTEQECADKCTADAACVAFSRWATACYKYHEGHSNTMSFAEGDASYGDAKANNYRQMDRCTETNRVARLVHRLEELKEEIFEENHRQFVN